MVTSGASIPARARLETAAIVMRSPYRVGTHAARRGLPARAAGLAGFELGDASLQLAELRLSSLEQLFLHVEIFAGNEVEAVEPTGEERPQVLVHISRGRVTQCLGDAIVQFLNKALVDHRRKLTSRGGTTFGHRAGSVPQIEASLS